MKFSQYNEKAPVGALSTSPYIKRYEHNPILTNADVPYKTDLAFNAGANYFHGVWYLAFRFDVFSPEHTGIVNSGTGFAESSDGIHWKVADSPLRFHYRGRQLSFVNDARLTVLEDQLYLSFCFNSVHGERPGIAVWRGGVDFEVICLGIPAQRNLILCPERINGKFWRLERPATRRPLYDMWLSYSSDLVHWGEAQLLLGVEDVPFATRKIGGGAPPIRTDRGWLLLFHSVDSDPAREIVYEKPWHAQWDLRYTMGAVLLDLNDPSIVLAITQKPLLVPEMPYETGNIELFFRENVIFPCGAVPEREHLRIYYGAGDYSTCMATIRWEDLWKTLTPYRRYADDALYSNGDVNEMNHCDRKK